MFITCSTITVHHLWHGRGVGWVGGGGSGGGGKQGLGHMKNALVGVLTI